MTTVNDVIKALKGKNISVSSGDSDETTVIVFDTSEEEIRKALKGLQYSLHNGHSGIVIIPRG